MSDEPLLLGGRYEVGALIGRGGMAEVHLGHDTRLGRQVAIKMLRSDLARDPSFIRRFRREAQSSAGLNHSSIVAVYDSGEDHHIESGGAKVGVPYMVMEYVEGRTLREVLTEKQKLPTEEACRVTEGVLDALAYSHRMGIVHRDIKPANVMVANDGTVKVMDFGIARAIADTAATMTQTQAVIGTAQYLSPEQAQGATVDARSDLYSAGCMLYELLTGRPPFVGDSPVSIAYQHVGEKPVPPSSLDADLSDDLDAVVLHALAKPREDRYQDADSFRDDLRSARLGQPISEEATAAMAALGAGAVATVGGDAEPTEVYAVQTGPDGTAPPGGAGGAGGPGGPPGSNTSTFPAVDPSRSGGGRSGKRIALVAVALLAALTLLGFGVMQFMEAQKEAAKVGVPGVVGLLENDARQKLTTAGLKPVVTREASDTVDDGKVISQNPEAGVKVEKAASVAIVVSTGPDAVVVPDVANLTVEQATAELEKFDLVVGETKDVDSKLKKGTVVSTDPKIGGSVKPNSTINLNVSTGKVAVPDLTGKTGDEASAQLYELGLVPETKYRQTSQAKEGTVVDQEPDEGDKLDVGSKVTITIAQKAPPPVTKTPTPSSTPTPSPTPSPSATSPTPSPSPSESEGQVR